MYTYLNKKIIISKRQFQILQKLEKENDWIDSKKLADKLNVSTKTIHNDLIKLQKILPDEWSLKSQRGIGFYLKGPLNETVSLRFTFDDSNDFYQTIKLLIDKEKMTIYELAEYLYTSTSYAHGLIQEISQEIYIEDKIIVGSKPLQIIADEFYLRYLLFKAQYKYYIKTSNYNLPIPATLNVPCEFEYNLRSLLQKAGINLSHHGYCMLLQLIDTFKTRQQKNKYVKNFDLHQLSESHSFFYTKNNLLIMDSFVTKVFTTFDLVKTSEEKSAFLALFSLIEYSYTSNYLSLTNHENLTKFNEFLSFLHSHLKFKIQKNNVLELFSLFRKNAISNLLNIEPFLYEEEFFTYLLEKYPEILTYIEELLNKWNEQEDASTLKFVWDEININLCLVLIKAAADAIKIQGVLISQRSTLLSDYLDSLISNLFQKSIDFEVLDSYCFLSYKHSAYSSLNPDFIITDSNHILSIVREDVPTLYIDSLFNERHLSDLTNVINSLFKEKLLSFFIKH